MAEKANSGGLTSLCLVLTGEASLEKKRHQVQFVQKEDAALLVPWSQSIHQQMQRLQKALEQGSTIRRILEKSYRMHERK